MSASFLIGTAAGAVIGGITNGIAIKMLFRPLNPVKIGRYTLPFTPGVIPKERERIASKVGQVISQELLNQEVLRDWLLKEEVIKEIDRSLDEYLNKIEQDNKTLEEFLEEFMGKERSTYLICEIEETVTSKVYGKIVSMELGKIIVEKMQEAFKKDSFGSLLGPMSFFINDSLIENIAHKIEPMISQFIVDEGEEIIRKAVEDEREKLMETKVSEAAEKMSSYREIFKRKVIKSYERLIDNHISTILNTLKIEKIVEERILSLDMLEVEKIILSIMRKELNAIVWLGVFLGAIMGTLTYLI